MANEKFSSTKDLKKTLGKKELFGIAVGQIIGAGIMSMMGIGIAMTGRSANLSFMISAFFTLCTFIPVIFVSSCVRLRGGQYSQIGLFAGDKFAGAFSIIYVVQNMTIAMYSISFAEYFIALVPSAPSRIVALSVATLFFVLNFFGVDIMAKIQNVMVIVLVLALALFAFYGLPQVDFGTYFNNSDGLFVTDGFSGVMTAAAYLAFATGGANIILNVSAECKNPKGDIPFVIIISTVGVAFLYGLVSTAAAGVLPTMEVMGKPLTLVAEKIFPPALYIFFIVGGAMFALATTLNAKLMSVSKPMMQACEDGWFPKSLASLSKYGTPWKILLFFYIVGVSPIAIGLDISQISSIVLIVGYCVTITITLTTFRLPIMFPEQWEKSPFKVPKGVFYTMLGLSACVTVIQFTFMTKSVTPMILIFNTCVVIFAFIFSLTRIKMGGVKVTVSYDLE